jgi:hypothetical protein
LRFALIRLADIPGKFGLFSVNQTDKMRLLIVVILNSLSVISAHGQKNKTRTILVLSTNLFTTTIIAVPCDSFEAQFKGAMDTAFISSPEKIAILDGLVKKIGYSKKESWPDTRAEFIFMNSDGKQFRIYMDMFDIFIAGHLVENKELFRFLRSLIPRRQLRMWN